MKKNLLAEFFLLHIFLCWRCVKSPVDRINVTKWGFDLCNFIYFVKLCLFSICRKNCYYWCLLVFIHVVLSFSEDRNSVNKLSETIRTNFNERVDEVTKYCYMLYITVTVFIVTNSISVMIYRLVSQNISVIWLNLGIDCKPGCLRDAYLLIYSKWISCKLKYIQAEQYMSRLVVICVELM